MSVSLRFLRFYVISRYCVDINYALHDLKIAAFDQYASGKQLI
jgi:hypothetical protein